jgi:hypothetical protein
MDESVEVELLFTPGCASRQGTWAMVEKVLADSEIAAAIRETIISIPEQAEQKKFLGSPSVRVNGIDIEPAAALRDDFGLG